MDDRIRRNVQRMIEQKAPEQDIDGYLASEGLTPEQFKAEVQKSGMGERQSSVRGALQTGLSGATFGFNDELQAGIAGVKGAVTGEGFGPAYDRKLAQARAEEKQFRGEHPIIGTGLTVGGALATAPAGLGIPKLGIPAVKTIPGLLGLGAAEGAVAGFGAGEGGTAERLKGAGTGALMGAGTAGIASAGIPVASAGYRAGKALMAGKQGRAANRATKKAAQALKRDEASIGEIAKSYEARQAANPKPEVLADLAGENTRDLAAVVHSTPGKGKNQAEKFLVERQMGDPFDPTVSSGQAARVIGDAETALAGGPTKSASQTTDELMAARKGAADPLYKRAWTESGPISVSSLLDHINNRLTVAKGPIRSTLERARRLLVDKEGNPETNIRALHEAKLALDEMMDRSAQNSLGNTARREVREIQEWLLASMDAGSKGMYAEARAAFSGPSKSMEAVEMGRNVFKEDAGITARDIRALSPADREFFTVGVIQAVREQAKGTTNTGDVVRKLMGNPNLRERLGAAVPNPKDFTNFVFDLEREAAMSRTFAKTRGSRTAVLEKNMEDAGDTAIGAAVDVATGNKVGLVRRMVNAAGKGKMDEGTAAELRKLLIDPQNTRAAMTQLQRYDETIKAMIDRRRKLSEALARTAGGQGPGFNQEVDASLSRFGFR